MDEIERVHPLREAFKKLGLHALASAAPIVGPPALALFDGVTFARWQNRVVDEVERLENRISGLEGRVDRDFVKTSEFADLLADAMLEAARLEDEVRRHLYSSVVVAASLEGPGSQIKARRMMRRIEALDTIHFHLLKAMALEWDTIEGPAPSNSASTHMALLLSKVTGQREGENHARRLLEDLAHEGHIKQQFVDNLGAITSTFSKRDAKIAVTRQGFETLKYLWPEEFLSQT